jgi:hypothetical protein
MLNEFADSHLAIIWMYRFQEEYGNEGNSDEPCKHLLCFDRQMWLIDGLNEWIALLI